MTPNKLEREAIYDEVKSRVNAYMQRHMGKDAKDGYACLYWAYFGCQVLNERGIRAQPQAGTAYWIKTDYDDGKSDNSFGHEFHWNRTAYKMLAEAKLPEMHVWIAVTEPEPQIIDFTSQFFKTRCIAEGLSWDTSDPPKYLWVEIDEDIPAVYRPSLQAIELVYALWKLNFAPDVDVLQFRMLEPLED